MNSEFYYGVIITAVCIPPFVHYAMRFIRSGLPAALILYASFKIATRKDLAETKRLLRRK